MSVTSVRAETRDFGAMPGGGRVEAVTLSAGPVALTILTLGGVLQSALLPDRDGRLAQVTLGHDDVAPYFAGSGYFGGIIGRTAGRIAGGRIVVDGVPYRLSTNENGNTLHGGAQGFDRALWQLVAAGIEDGGAVLRLAHHSPAGDQGYPGAVDVAAVYRLDAAGFTLQLTATSDAPTPVNLTWHPYWNLSGTGASVADHILQLDASAFYPSGSAQVTQSAKSVSRTAFDLRMPQALADIMASADPQVAMAGGIDHVFVRGSGSAAAVLRHPASGRRLTVASPEPALVVYTGNGLAGSPPGHGGIVINGHGGIAFEPQALPDAVPILRPGAPMQWRMALHFGVEPTGATP